MGRTKRVSDEEVLARARDVFLARGYTASTREVADAVGLSQATLFQRFGSKDDLFVAAITPAPFDVARILGNFDPKIDEPLEHLQALLGRLNTAISTTLPPLLRLAGATDLPPSIMQAVHGRLGATDLICGLEARFSALACSLGTCVGFSTQSTTQLVMFTAHGRALATAMGGDEGLVALRDSVRVEAQTLLASLNERAAKSEDADRNNRKRQ